MAIYKERQTIYSHVQMLLTYPDMPILLIYTRVQMLLIKSVTGDACKQGW